MVNISYVLIEEYKFLMHFASVVFIIRERNPNGINLSKAWRFLTYCLNNVCANIFRLDGIDMVDNLVRKKHNGVTWIEKKPKIK